MRRPLLVLSAVLFGLFASFVLWQPGVESVLAQATVPGQPTNLSLTSGEDSITLSWTAPSDGGSPITYYHITYQKSGDSSSLVNHYTDGPEGFDPTAATPTVTFEDLDVSKYEVTVAAGNDNGQGDFVTGTVATSTYVTPVISVVSHSVNEDLTITVEVGIDPAPAGIVYFDYQASRVSGDTATVGDISDEGVDISGGLNTDGFFDNGTAAFSPVLDVAQDAIDEDDETFTLTLSNLTGSDAMFEGGRSTLTSKITIIDDDRAASAPRRVHAYWDEIDSIWLDWDEPADLGEADGAPGTVNNYQYRTATTRSGLAGASWQDTADTNTFHALRTPATGNHYFQVRAITHYNGAIASAISNVAAATAGSDVQFNDSNGFVINEGESLPLRFRLRTQPTHDVTITITKSGANSAALTLDRSTLTFSAADFDSDGTFLDGYDDWQEIQVTASEDDMDDADGAATVDFRLTSSDANYNSKSVVADVIINDDESTLAPPQNFHAAPRDKRIAVSWDAATGAGSYTITWTCGSDAAQSHTTADGTVATYEIPDLTNGVECSVSMKANGTNVDGGTFDSQPTDPQAATPIALVVITPTVLSLDENPLSEDNSKQYTIVLTQQPVNTVWILANNPDTSKLLITGGSSGELTFVPDDYDIPQTLTVWANDDDDPLDDTLTVTHTVESVSDRTYDGLAIDSVTVTVTDDDEAGIRTNQDLEVGLEMDEGDVGRSIFFSLESQPTEDVVVTVTSSDPGAVSLEDSNFRPIDSAEFTIQWDNYEFEHQVNLIAMDDDDAVDESVSITFSIKDRSKYDAQDVAVPVTVRDTDSAGITLSWGDLYPDVNESGDGNTATYNVVLDSQPTGTVTVAVQNSDPSAATVNPTSLTFDATNWNDPQRVTITGVNDDIDNSDDRREVTLTHTASGADYDDPGLVEVQTLPFFVFDDDVRGITGTADDRFPVSESGTATYTVVLDSQPTGTVTITPAVDVSSADYGALTVSGTLTFDATNWDGPSDGDHHRRRRRH